MNRKKLGYFIIRIMVGLILIIQGFENLLNLNCFEMQAIENILKTKILPSNWFYDFVVGIPFMEFLSGLLLIAGFFTKFVLKASHYIIMLVSLVLILGHDLETAFLYIILATVIFFLLIKIQYNKWSLDNRVV